MNPKRKTFSITLDEDLIREAKKRAIDEDKTLYQFIEDALCLALMAPPDRARNKQFATKKGE